MSFEKERLAIENRFSEYWTYTPVAWENVEFDTPNNEGWVRLNILNGEGDYRAINKLKRHTGIIVVQIFVPRDTGTSTIRQYADYASSIFDGRKFNDVVCGVGSIETIGADDIWYQVNVTIPYWRDE
mgnify:CR=1 FL=1|jgi:hypothetical protein